jgi:hypothetical protein
MRKAKIRECPFCGRIPSGKRFCSTDRGPAMECDHCGSMGPAALDREFIGANEDKFNPQAIQKWNQRSFDRDSYQMGIEAASSFVEMFDKHVQHPYRLSDCILCKFNLISKRKLRKNVPDRRTPARRKGDRRVPGGPEFVLGSMTSQERRNRGRREGVRRRRS